MDYLREVLRQFQREAVSLDIATQNELASVISAHYQRGGVASDFIDLGFRKDTNFPTFDQERVISRGLGLPSDILTYRQASNYLVKSMYPQMMEYAAGRSSQ